MLIGLALIGLVAAGLCGIGNHVKSTVMRDQCAFNLHQIAVACLEYASHDPQGRFPGRFEDVLLKEDISAAAFCCPDTDDTPPVGPTTQAVVGQLSAGGHLSYIYVGSSATNRDPPNVVVAYEPLKNHHGDGMNVLFTDGHIEWLTAAQGKKLLAVAPPAAAGKIIWDGKAARVATTQP